MQMTVRPGIDLCVCGILQVDGEGGWEQGHRWDASKLCIDPYAPLIEGRRRFGVRDEVEQFRTKVSSPASAADAMQATLSCNALS